MDSDFINKYSKETRKRALLVVNPKAGGARACSMIAPVVEKLSNAGYETRCFTTTCRGDASSIAADYGAEADLLVCCGGDGTVNETVSGVMQLDRSERPAIGYIPMGSTNDYASALGLPRRRDLLIDTALFGSPREVDVGCFNGRFFAYLASFGAFTDISLNTSQEAKNVFGVLAYIGSGMNSLANIRPIHTDVIVNGNIITDDYAFASVSNTRSVAGVINYNRGEPVDLNDGLFEIMLIRYPRNAAELSAIARALSTGDFGGEYTQRITAGEVRFLFSEPVDWILDGERAEAGHEVFVKNIRSAVRMMLPAEGRRRYQPLLRIPAHEV